MKKTPLKRKSPLLSHQRPKNYHPRQRTKTEIKQAYTKKVLEPIGTEKWIDMDSFAGWACEAVA